MSNEDKLSSEKICGIHESLSKKRKKSRLSADGTRVLSFTSEGLSSYFYAPRPIWRGNESGCSYESYENRVNDLDISHLIDEERYRAITEGVKRELKNYDFVTSSRTNNDSALKRSAAPHWLVMRANALDVMGSAIALYQGSMELETAYKDQEYQEQFADTLIDASDSARMKANERLMLANMRNQELEMEIHQLKNAARSPPPPTGSFLVSSCPGPHVHLGHRQLLSPNQLTIDQFFDPHSTVASPTSSSSSYSSHNRYFDEKDEDKQLVLSLSPLYSPLSGPPEDEEHDEEQQQRTPVCPRTPTLTLDF